MDYGDIPHELRNMFGVCYRLAEDDRSWIFSVLDFVLDNSDDLFIALWQKNLAIQLRECVAITGIEDELQVLQFVGFDTVLNARQPSVANRIDETVFKYCFAEDFAKVGVVDSIWRCSHSQQKLWSKILDSLSVSFGWCVVCLVDKDIVELARVEIVEMEVY